MTSVLYKNLGFPVWPDAFHEDDFSLKRFDFNEFFFFSFSSLQSLFLEILSVVWVTKYRVTLQLNMEFNPKLCALYNTILYLKCSKVKVYEYNLITYSSKLV